MSLFLNLLHLTPRATDAALEFIYKAVDDGHDHDGGTWLPHDSPLIRRLIELFTQRGLERLAGVKREIDGWMKGDFHKPGSAAVQLPAGSMARWSDAELALARIYLEALPPALWTLDDHMMAVDLVVQRYLPSDALTTEAEWLATRAGMMGKVQASMSKQATASQADALMSVLPSTVAAAVQHFALAPAEVAMLDFGRVRAVENVRALSDRVRHKMRSVVMRHLEHQATVGPIGSSLETKLFDEFATLNRDWRRIAITEAGEQQLQGLIASLKPGTRVKRFEQYRGACAFCRKIHGRIATVVDASKLDKDPEKEVWVGKNNVGLSASPRKRVGDVLVEREPKEMWQLPAGLAHPNCRGRWIVLEDDIQPGDDPDFEAFLEATLGGPMTASSDTPPE